MESKLLTPHRISFIGTSFRFKNELENPSQPHQEPNCKCYPPDEKNQAILIGERIENLGFELFPVTFNQ